MANPGICSCCGVWAHKRELHHVLLNRDKNNKEFVNHHFNLAAVDVICHNGRALTYDFKEKHMRGIIAQYGAPAVLEWLESATDNKKRGSMFRTAFLLYERIVAEG